MNRCPYCSTDWAHHSARCVGGVPAVDLRDDRGLAGRVISGYGIIGRIGEGGMGTVYLAVDNITEQRLDAVKVLNRDLVIDRERMRREAITANRVQHPNVCQIYNYVEAYDAEAGETLTLIAMELVRGPTLREVQSQSGGILELDRAARVVREVANALQAVHAGGIIHRDIKPNNIIVTSDPDGTERVKLVDFGIAKKEAGGEGQDLTEAGYVAATVHYASPEQLKGKAESRSDIYSLGVVLFELLTGARPFEASNQAELYSLILDPRVSVPRLSGIRTDLDFPRSLQAILDRALARDPEKRYATASEFADAVGRLVPDLAKTVVSPITDFALPPAIPTIPSRRAPTGQDGGGRGGTLQRMIAPLAARGSVLKLGGAVAVLGVAAVLFVSLGGGGALRQLFGGGEGEESVTPGGQASPGGGIIPSQGQDTLEVPELRGPAYIRLGREDLSLDPGGRVRLEAEVIDNAGAALPNREVRWASSQPSVAEVDAQGWVTGHAPGTATITASIDTVTASAAVRVRQPPPPPDSQVDSAQRTEVCADAMAVLDPLLDDLMGIEVRSVLQTRLDLANGCWGRSDLRAPERAFAAYSIGMITWRIERIGGREEGCSANVITWLERASQLGQEDQARREIYDSALNGCRGGTE